MYSQIVNNKCWGNQKCPYWHSYKIRPNTSSALTLILRLFSLYKNDNIIMVMLLSVCVYIVDNAAGPRQPVDWNVFTDKTKLLF